MFHVYRFIVTFSNRAPDPENDSAAVQEFLENMEGAFRAHTPWAGSSEEELESAGEVISLLSLNYSLIATLLITTTICSLKRATIGVVCYMLLGT
jgi:hypothetical protein